MAFNWMDLLPGFGPDPAVRAAEIQADAQQAQRDWETNQRAIAAQDARDLQNARDRAAAAGRDFSSRQSASSQAFSAEQKNIDRANRSSELSQARRDRAAEIGQARADKERERQQEVQIVYDKMAAEERERAELIKLKKAQMPGKKRIDVMKAAGKAPQHWGSVYRYVDNSDPDYYDLEHERVI